MATSTERPATRLLIVLAAGIWLAVGAMLATRGVGMLLRSRELEGRSVTAIVVAGLVGLAIGALKGRFVLTRTAKRNARRIRALDEPRPWKVFRPRFYLLIALMIGLGISLRSLAAAGYLYGFAGVGGLYVGIGAALAASAPAYFSRRPPPRVDTCAMLDRARARGALAATPEAPIGVLLTNLGTPKSPETKDVRRYLRQFLGDPRVVEVSRPVWWFVLNVIILPFRSPKSAALYRRVWTPEGSPLLVIGKEQRDGLQELLGDTYRVVLAMRYGEPSMAAGLAELEAAGCQDIVVATLFPQYSGSTTGSVADELFRLYDGRRIVPGLRLLPPCFEHEGYVRALAERFRETPGTSEVDHVVFSFHGIPESYVERGDPYAEQCARTAHLLADELGLASGGWTFAFQSRFGDEPWLQPYVDELVVRLATTHPRIAVLTPGFAADCLETIDEIGVELVEEFEEAGGQELIRVPSLNASETYLATLAHQIRGEAAGIPEPSPVAL